MNERIQRLILAAQQEAAKETIQNSFAYENLVYAKFAELIVRECADIAKHHVMNISTYADADFVDEQIKEHFGVEE